VLVVAVLLAVGIPVYLQKVQDNNAVTLLWVMVCLYLMFRLLRNVVRRLRLAPGGPEATKQVAAKKKAEGIEGGTVAWLLGPASFSPSRDAAERNLPGYCRRLIG
jgi:hypothetical protein